MLGVWIGMMIAVVTMSMIVILVKVRMSHTTRALLWTIVFGVMWVLIGLIMFVWSGNSFDVSVKISYAILSVSETFVPATIFAIVASAGQFSSRTNEGTSQ